MTADDTIVVGQFEDPPAGGEYRYGSCTPIEVYYYYGTEVSGWLYICLLDHVHMPEHNYNIIIFNADKLIHNGENDHNLSHYVVTALNYVIITIVIRDHYYKVLIIQLQI